MNYVPAHGWKLSRQRTGSAVYKSGKDELLVTKVGAAWVVTDFELCLD
jgi:hypothetical protein